MEKIYSIKQVVEKTGLKASNIRYYEREGLIKGIKRNDVGVRQFMEKDVEWIRFLAKLKDMEMTIEMMKQYAILREKGDSTVVARINLLKSHRGLLLEKISKIEDYILLLDNKINVYQKVGIDKYEK